MTKALIVLFLALLPQSEMVTPKVEHRTESYTQNIETVKRTCPEGYEGHYVDIQPGFDNENWGGYAGGSWVNNPFGIVGAGAPAYTICFKKDFMDNLRKNPEMQSSRPLPPRGV